MQYKVLFFIVFLNKKALNIKIQGFIILFNYKNFPFTRVSSILQRFFALIRLSIPDYRQSNSW